MSVRPKKSEIAQFVGAVFKHADPEAFVSLRSFPQFSGEGQPRISTVRAIPQLIVDAAYREAQLDSECDEARVFCPPVATFRDKSNARQSNLAQGLVIVADLDRRPKKGLARLKKVLGTPTAISESGGVAKTRHGNQRRLHVYWRLRTPTLSAEEHALLKEAQRLATLIGLSDPTAVPVVHPLRWPGTIHEKAEPRLARIVVCNNDVEIDLTAALRALRKAAKVVPTKARPKKKPRSGGARTASTLPEAQSVSEMMTQIITGKGYHGPLRQLAMRHARHGMAQAAIVETLQGVMLSVPDEVRATAKERRRWNDRYDRIPRLVSSAIEKLDSEASWLDPLPLPSVQPVVPVMTGDMLPRRFRKWLLAAAAAMQLPLEFLAVPALTGAGAAVGRRLAIQPKRNDGSWVVVPNVWGCVIGSPASMKSPAASIGLGPLLSFEADARVRNKDARERHERAVREYKARSEALKPQLRKRLADKPDANIDDLVGEPPPAPALRRYVVVDATPEQMGAIHADNPNGLLIHRDELAPFLTRLERDEKADERALYLTGWSGLDGYTWDRVGRGHINIPALCLSVFGTTQPDKIVPYIQKLAGAGDGLIQRFGLFVWPDIPPDWRNVDKEQDSTVLDRVRATFRRLMRTDPTKLAHAVLSPRGVYVVKFSARAQKRFERWHKSLELSVRRDGLPPILEAHLGKYRSLIPGLALLFHLIDGGEGPVSLNAMKLAARWAVYLEAHARRIYGTVLRADVLGAEVLLKHIQNGDLSASFSARDVYRSNWHQLTDLKAVDAALSVLMDCQIVRRRTHTEKGRKAVVYDVNPKVKRAGGRPRA